MPPADQVTQGGAAPAAGASGSAAAGAAGAPPAPSSTDSAIDAAKQRLASSGSILPAGGEGGEGGAGGGDGGDGGEGAGEGNEAGAAGGEGGAEGGEAGGEGGAGAAAGEEGAGAEGGEAGAEGRTLTLEREGKEPITLELPEDQEAADYIRGLLRPDDHDELNFTLPGAEDRGEEDLVLEAPNKAAWERLNRQANEAAVGRQVKAERRQLERQVEELEAIEDQIKGDPTGFVLDQLPDTTRIEVAMQLLFEPGTFGAIQKRLGEAGYEGGIAGILEDEQAIRTLRAELGKSRSDLRLELSQQAEERRTMRQNASRVAAQIEQLIPEEVVGEQRERLFQGARDEIIARCKRLGIKTLEPDDVTWMVGAMLRRAGIAAAAPNGGNGQGGKGGAKPPATPGKTAAQFKQGSAARRAAAAAAPAGAGAPGAKVRPTLPPTTEGRIEYMKKHGIRAALGLR